MNRRYTLYLLAAIIITIVCFMGHAQSQLVLRAGANDPQIQMARDMANKTSAAGQPNWPTDVVDLANSLNTFYAIANKDGMTTASNAILDGKVPEIPKGVFEAARKSGENRVTWQPKKGVRSALVVEHFSGSNGEGFVAVGRSLKEVETREKQSFHIALMSEIILLLVSFFGINYLIKK